MPIKKYFYEERIYKTEEILNNIEHLYSKNKIRIICDFNLSEKCLKEYISSGESIKKGFKKNNNKVLCFQCAILQKGTGRNGYKTKYKNLDDNFFEIIDTEEKAYLLGWIASDGTITEKTFAIEVSKIDLNCLKKIKNIISTEVPIRYRKNRDMVSFAIYSEKISKDLCKLLSVNPGKKSDIVQMPSLNTDELQWAFIRGYFDGDGSINNCRDLTTRGIPKTPHCCIASNSEVILKQIKKFIQIPCNLYKGELNLNGNNALDFLGKIYEKAKIFLDRKYYLYEEWSVWVPSITGPHASGKMPGFYWAKTHKDAVPPSKSRISDSGYDLVLIKKIKTLGKVEFYDTGIKIQPDFGLYFDCVPRSSITKYPYVFANSVGVLDRTYTGSVLVALIKYDETAPDLELPCKLMQIIPRYIIHLQAIEVSDEEFEATSRAEGGFGSTDNV